MVNTGFNCSNGTVISPPPPQDKQMQDPLLIKKTALRDVQNENLGTQQRTGGTKPSICGTKREVPTSSQPLPSLLQRNDLHENVMNARRRFDLELGRGRLSNVETYALAKKVGQSWQDVPVMASRAKNTTTSVKSNVMTPIMAFSGPTPSLPTTFGKNIDVRSEVGKVVAKEVPRSEAVKVIAKEVPRSEAVKVVAKDVPRSVSLKSTDEQKRMERYNNLQMFLKKCDEDDQREYMQMLLRLSPDELSKRAWELEHRAMILTLDEGAEMKRQSQLNILAKPSASNNLLQSDKS